MKLIKIFPAVALAAMSVLFVACEEDANSIGSSLIQSESKIVIEDGFKVTGHSVENDKIQSRTVTQLIGSIDAKEYGKFTSDFVTQFMPAVKLDTTLVSSQAIDSVKLLMMYQIGGFVGDSVVPMGVEVFRLKKQLEAPIFSDFSPTDYYDPQSPIGSSVYGASGVELSDSLKELNYREILVNLPKSLGAELFDLYKTNPDAYATPTAFAKYFPGLYVRNSYGSGRVTRVEATGITFYYHFDTTVASRDTTINYVRNFYMATPEIISNNNIKYEISPALTEMIAQGEDIIVAPAGMDVEITFPLNEVISYYKANSGRLSVINNLTMSIPALKIANEYGIQPPAQLLMVLKDKKKEFFEKSQITDGVTSFYATFNQSTASYDFSSLRNYLLDALDKKELTEKDFTFVLTPVVVNTETSGSYYATTSVITSIVPYIQQPAMTKLNLEDTKIVLTFSNQNVKN